MAKLLLMLLVLLVVLAGMSLGCTSSSVPSNDEIEKVILSYLQKSATGLAGNPYRDVQAVEVIELGEPDEDGMTMWPVEVRIVRPNSEERATFIIFRDTFGQLKVLRRSTMSSFEMIPLFG